MILFFVVGVSSLSVIGTYSYFNAKHAILKRTLDQLTSIRVIKKEQVEFFFRERFNNLELLSGNDYLNTTIKDNYGKNQSHRKLTVQKFNYNLLGFSNIYLISGLPGNTLSIFSIQTGNITPANADSITINQFQELWNNTTLNGEPRIADFKKRFKNDTEPVCFIGKKLPAEGHGIMLAAQIPISDINRMMLENNAENGLGKSGEVYLVGNDYLMRSTSRFIENSVLNTEVKSQSVINAFKNQYGSSLIDDYRTVACLSSYDRISISGLNWAILAEIDYNEAMIPIISIRNDILFLSLVICVFLFSISHFISKTITTPIIRLKKAAKKIGEGTLDVNLQPKSQDEIGLLTTTFNTMAQQLKSERLQRMSALYDGQEMERQRISRELHDGLGQKLVAIKMQLEGAGKAKPNEVTDRVKEISENLIKTIDEVKQISNNLAPNILNESGIDIALKSLCNSLAKTTEIDIEFSTFGDFQTTDPKVKSYIYRIAQEGLTNAIKHSEASKIQLQLIGSKNNIILVLEDNGKGFVYGSSFCTPCNGIYNMKERARLLNGTLDIETEPLSGTTIRLKVPKQN